MTLNSRVTLSLKDFLMKFLVLVLNAGESRSRHRYLTFLLLEGHEFRASGGFFEGVYI